MYETIAYYSELVPFYMTVGSLAIVAVEWAVLAILQQIERHREGWVNVGSAVLTFIPAFILNKVILITLMFFLFSHSLFELGFDWYVWIFAYIAYDFMSYALHYLSHKVRFFWCIHSVHHSPKEMKASVAFRGSFAEVLISPHLILWLPLIGFHPFMVVIVEGIAMLYGVLLHLNENYVPKAKRPWLRWLLITPSSHRLHHASNDIYLDTNYGLTFSIWDRVFRTFQSRVAEVEPVYGLTKEIASDNLWVAQTDEFVCLWRDVRGAEKWGDKLRYLVKPPGWNPGMSGETAREVRRRALLGKE